MNRTLSAIHNVRYPGLSPDGAEIPSLAEELIRELAVIRYKAKTLTPWVILLGGTGTGKSTLFNVFCGLPLSATGIERPKTFGPVAYAHETVEWDEAFPFPHMEVRTHSPLESQEKPVSGVSGRLVVIPHGGRALSHFVLVDTPDVDSVEERNRLIAEDLYLLADAVIFVASPEKYADDMTVQVLRRILEEQKPVYYLFNKAGEEFGRDDILKIFESQGLVVPKNRIYLFPHVTGGIPAKLFEKPVVQGFLQTLEVDFGPENIQDLCREQQQALKARSQQKLMRLALLLEVEEEASEKWLESLKQLSRRAVDDFLKGEEARFKANSNQYIRMEIRRLFARYDLLAKPRRLIQGIILTPFRYFTGRKAVGSDDRREDLAKLRKNSDSAVLLSVLEQFNRRVLEKLSPADTHTPLAVELRRSGLTLTEREVEDRMVEEREALLKWIDGRFTELADGLSSKKKWGIYTASILWGVLLISVTATLGGGFSMVDVALDSALAPFITKGTTGLLAYQEISKITYELGKQHKEGLAAIIEEQCFRYRQCLMDLRTPPDALAAILERAVKNPNMFGV